MKKSYTLIILLFLVFTACKKDQASTSTDLKTQMTGRWNYVSLVGNNYDTNGKLLGQQSSYTGVSGDYIQFNGDGTYVENLVPGTHLTGTYTINSTTRFTLSPGVDNPCRVVNIDNGTFTFIVEGPKYSGYGYIEYTHSLKK
ncbi:hypothetical protein BDD43_0307 [Mucilaginibacter gracilis]|uniref:Lipocalin-like protein n=1 Tax=Mucilaginibacter gracilis TaxID=423350 RepID=A0A495IV77_9SPHI|nr:hypothetical protein [Mucilaginibacter gracilis]RKR80211.1 hypothetical protein BDD43_0307 [Mucilaginibacter gracilis]